MIDTHEEEIAIIGAICQEPKLIRVVERVVEPEHFFYESCRTVYEYAVRQDADGKVFDALIAADALKGQIPEIRNFLAECMEVVPTTANTEEYARLLRSKSDERTLREKVGMALSEESGEKLTETIAAICAEQIEQRPGGGMKKLDRVMKKTYEQLFEKPENRMDTGYGKLDGVLMGLWGGELIVIAARPAVGKSAFAWSVIENAAKKSGKAVHLHSLEMEDTEVGERELARHTTQATMNNIIDRRDRSGGLYESRDDVILQDLAAAYGEAAGLPIYIDDAPNQKPSRVRTEALTRKNLGLIVVDYGGLMTADRKHESRNLELGAISRDLKNLAKELKVPVIMLAQLNRSVPDTQKPTLAALRDSGELEQNANKVIFLWNIDKETGTVGVNVAKNRRGKTGDVVMQFDGAHMRFYETEEHYEEPQRRGKPASGWTEDND